MIEWNRNGVADRHTRLHLNSRMPLANNKLTISHKNDKMQTRKSWTIQIHPWILLAVYTAAHLWEKRKNKLTEIRRIENRRHQLLTRRYSTCRLIPVGTNSANASNRWQTSVILMFCVGLLGIAIIELLFGISLPLRNVIREKKL